MDSSMIWVLVFIVVGLLFAQQFKRAPAPLSAESVSGKVRHVVDGDSLYINGHKPQIRLWGVDAPERDEAGYDAATRQLSALAKGKRVRCDIIDRDHYGRTVARCFLSDGREINREMIESGTTTEYRRFTKGFYSR